MTKDLVEFRAAAIPKKSSSSFDMGGLLSAVKSASRHENRRAARRGERERERKEWARREIAMVRQKRERERVLWSRRLGYPNSSSSASSKNPLSSRTMRRLWKLHWRTRCSGYYYPIYLGLPGFSRPGAFPPRFRPRYVPPRMFLHPALCFSEARRRMELYGALLGDTNAYDLQDFFSVFSLP